MPELPDFCREGCYWTDCGHRGLRIESEGYVTIYSWDGRRLEPRQASLPEQPPPPLPVVAYPWSPGGGFGVLTGAPPRGEDEQRDS